MARVKTSAPDLPALDDRGRRFADMLVTTGGDWVEAARRLRLPENEGRRLMANSSVLLLAERMRREPTSPQATAAYVKACWLRLVTADPRELTEHWRVPCRFCWGEKGLYQWRDAAEFEEARTKRDLEVARLLKGRRGNDDEGDEPVLYVSELSDLGGYGYTINREPRRGVDYVKFVQEVCAKAGRPPPSHLASNDAQSCARCDGHGLSYVIFHDTRYLSAAGAALYRGVKVTANGMEILTADKDKAKDALAKHLGMYNPRTPIPTLDPDKMTNEQLRAAVTLYAEIYGPGAEGEEEIPWLPS